MAVPLNTFKTITAELTTIEELLYVTPANKTTIVLMAQVSAVTSTPATVSAFHVAVDNDGSTLIPTELIKDFLVPGNDAVGILTGKLILQSGQSFSASAGTNGRLKIVLSLLETLNPV
jgi:hypothetical protein